MVINRKVKFLSLLLCVMFVLSQLGLSQVITDVFAIDEGKEIVSQLKITDEQGNPAADAYTLSKKGSVISTSFTTSGDYIISQENTGEIGENIVIPAGFSGNITLKNIKLFYNDGYSAGAPIQIDPTANVTLWIDGDNSIRAPQYYAGILFAADTVEEVTGSLTINSKTNGYLYVLGGGGAAIGGNDKLKAKNSTSNITIAGGRIKAQAFGVGSAAIGSGSDGDLGTMNITGGDITALGHSYNTMGGAAIGSGENGSVDTIDISGGKIYATNIQSFTSNEATAGIGAGYGGKFNSINISGGEITTKTTMGVGIGASLTYRTFTTGIINITGGTIKINRTDGGYGIGATSETVTLKDILVDGGNIDTTSFSTTPKNNKGEELAKLNINGLDNISQVLVDEQNFNIKSLTEDKQLILYLPKKAHTVKVTTNSGIKTYNVTWNGNEFVLGDQGKKTNKWLTAPSIQDWVYGEQSKTPLAQSEYGDVEFTYSTSENGTYTSEAPKDAGSYFLKATVKETDLYTGLQEIIPFNILKAQNSFTTEPIMNNWIYGETASAPQGSARFGTVEFLYSNSQNGQYTTNVPTNAGVYYLKASVAGTENYNGLEKVVRFEIIKAQNLFTKAPAISGWIFGKTPSTPSAAALFGNVLFTYSQSLNGEYTTNIPNKAGVWYLKASVQDNGNYTALEEVIEFTVEKGESSLVVEDIGFVYNGNEISTIQINGSSVAPKMQWFRRSGEFWQEIPNPPKDAGEYKVIITVGGDDNFKDTIIEKIFTIARATNNWIQIPTIENWIDGQNPNLPIGVSAFGDIVYTYSSTKYGGFSAEVPTKPGIYYLKASVIGNENYNSLEKIVRFEILSKDGTSVGNTNGNESIGNNQNGNVSDNQANNVQNNDSIKESNSNKTVTKDKADVLDLFVIMLSSGIVLLCVLLFIKHKKNKENV